LRVFENRVLRRIFGLERYEVRRDSKKNCIVSSFMLCISQEILLE